MNKNLNLNQLYLYIYLLKKFEHAISNNFIISLLNKFKLQYGKYINKNIFLNNSIYNIYTLSYFTFFNSNLLPLFTFEKNYNNMFRWFLKPYYYPIWHSTIWSSSYFYSKYTKNKKKKFKKKKSKRIGNKVAKLKINSFFKASSNNFYRKSNTFSISRTKELGSFFNSYTLYRLGNLQLLPSRNDYTKNFRKNKTFSRYYFNLKVHSLELFNLVYNKSKFKVSQDIELPSYLLDFFPNENHNLIMRDYSYFLSNLKNKVKNIQFLKKKKSYKLGRLNKLNFYIDKLFDISNTEFLKKSNNKLVNRNLLLSAKKFLKQRIWKPFKKKKTFRKYWTLATFKRCNWKRGNYIYRINSGQIKYQKRNINEKKSKLIELNKFKNKHNVSAKNNNYSKFKASTELDKNFDINKNKTTNVNKSSQLVKNKKKILEKRLQKKKNNRKASLLPNNIVLSSEFIANSTNTFKLSDMGITSKFEVFNTEDVSKIYNIKSIILPESVSAVNNKHDSYNLFNDSEYGTLNNATIPNPVPLLIDHAAFSEKVNIDCTLHNDAVSTLLPIVTDITTGNNENTDLNIKNSNKIMLTETNLNTDEIKNVVLKKKKNWRLKLKLIKMLKAL